MFSCSITALNPGFSNADKQTASTKRTHNYFRRSQPLDKNPWTPTAPSYSSVQNVRRCKRVGEVDRFVAHVAPADPRRDACSRWLSALCVLDLLRRTACRGSVVAAVVRCFRRTHMHKTPTPVPSDLPARCHQPIAGILCTGYVRHNTTLCVSCVCCSHNSHTRITYYAT